MERIKEMKIIENHCVCCELPCLGMSCPLTHVAVYYCDICRKEGADYMIEGTDYCKDCAEKHIQENFDELSIYEKADLLNIKLRGGF